MSPCSMSNSGRRTLAIGPAVRKWTTSVEPSTLADARRMSMPAGLVSLPAALVSMLMSPRGSTHV